MLDSLDTRSDRIRYQNYWGWDLQQWYKLVTIQDLNQIDATEKEPWGLFLSQSVCSTILKFLVKMILSVYMYV